MKRELPTHLIEGTAFIVDVSSEVLTQEDDASNKLFFHDLKDMGTHYSFLYDRMTKNMPDPLTREGQDIVEVSIPQMVTLDPVGMAEKYGRSIEEIEGKRDLDFLINPQDLETRLRGALPIIEITGHDFVVDVRLGEIRPWIYPDGPVISGSPIRLSGMDLSDDGEKLRFLFDSHTKEQIFLMPDATALPENAKVIEIPNELHLDPVATARLYDMEDTSLLREFPLQMRMKAIEIPLAETGLPHIIEKNRAKANKQFISPKLKKRKKGKRL